MSETQFLEIGGNRIAYRHTPGNGPAVVFLPGYMSDMAGGKATAIFDRCRQEGRECLLLDYSGCGQSGGNFADGSLTAWREDVLALVDAKLASRKIVLVGSSMGGWLALLVALALPDRVSGLVGIAPAPDFTDWGFDEDQKAIMRGGQTVYEENAYGYDPTPTHARFWTEGQKHLLLDKPIALTCPVRLVHGQEDEVVPPEISLRLAGAFDSGDVQVTLIKAGNHRLSRDSDIALLLRTIAALT
jgi:pimeloyl-ACP methyl ester carboxylesterase